MFGSANNFYFLAARVRRVLQQQRGEYIFHVSTCVSFFHIQIFENNLLIL